MNKDFEKIWEDSERRASLNKIKSNMRIAKRLREKNEERKKKKGKE